MDTSIFDRAASVLPASFFESAPDCGLVLGSGWGDVLHADRILAEISYQAIPGLGASTVLGHAGKLILFEKHGLRILACCGRRHWYEGVGWETVLLPMELMRRMGTQNVLVTNAAGGINASFKPGDLMLIRDQINLTGINPLIGPVVPGWGTRFPDQTALYDATLSQRLRQAAATLQLTLHEGVYIYASGPCFETPAEIRAYAALGADAVGMSTVHEVTVAHASGMRVAGLSCITNMAAGISNQQLSHHEVMEQSNQMTPIMAQLIDAFFAQLVIKTTAR